VYGETLSCLYAARKMGLPGIPEAWDLADGMLAHLERVWQRPDEGIWEVRGEKVRHFTHSKVEAWVAVDRAIGLIEGVRAVRRGRAGPVAASCARWPNDPRRGTGSGVAPGWARSPGRTVSEALDASVLIMRWSGSSTPPTAHVVPLWRLSRRP
jgi:hypothetical protein